VVYSRLPPVAKPFLPPSLIPSPRPIFWSRMKKEVISALRLSPSPFSVLRRRMAFH
jgi:hypothetical protein